MSEAAATELTPEPKPTAWRAKWVAKSVEDLEGQAGTWNHGWLRASHPGLIVQARAALQTALAMARARRLEAFTVDVNGDGKDGGSWSVTVRAPRLTMHRPAIAARARAGVADDSKPPNERQVQRRR